MKAPVRASLQRNTRQLLTLGFSSILGFFYIAYLLYSSEAYIGTNLHHPPPHAASIIAKCHALTAQTGPPADFHRRTVSDRFSEGTKPLLIKRARIWTGLENGTHVVHGDIFVDKGIIKSIGHVEKALSQELKDELVVVDAKGSWVTPGIVDIHSHLGDAPSPALDGAEDDNSLKGTAQPWLRSLDGLNTHDDSYPLSISGGVTTSLILPGSANAIGGQAFVIKLRHTDERTPSSMLLEPPFQINTSFPDPNLPSRWRHMKHACGENPSNVYKDTRLDTYWAFREAYNSARKIKQQQDEYCSSALSGKWNGLGDFPEELRWEALVDVLRGRVKVNVHCYEAVDLDALIRLSNEFKFPIAAFHHASEAYLVPDLIKRAYGKTPGVALFATNSRYKREAYRASEFAPRILAENGLTVLMKSDHPVLNSRYLLYEAQQAFFYGLPANLAIASVTSNSAEIAGMGHRVGYVREGWDADLVLWDSHPLALGATPTQVFIDGIPQLGNIYTSHKPDEFQKLPKVPNFDQEAKDAVKYEGLPPLKANVSSSGTFIFYNVKTAYTSQADGVQSTFGAESDISHGVVVVKNGTVACTGLRSSCLTQESENDVTFVDLEGGSISPALVSYGSPLGLQHIDQEGSTNDGDVYDPLTQSVPSVLGGDTSVIRAVDGLSFGSRDALLAFRSGVTTAISAPTHRGFFSGLGVSFSTGADHKLEKGAVQKEITGLHVSIRHRSAPSISTQIAVLRRLLMGKKEGAAGDWFKQVTQGEIPLVVEAHSADVIASLILLKKEVEHSTKLSMRMTISGAAEAHILAEELASSGVGVILNPPRPFPYVWEDRRILPGPPLTKESAVTKLVSAGVKVGIGCEEIWSARNLRFDLGWISLEGGGFLSKEVALAIGSTNLQTLLGAKNSDYDDLIVTRGGDLLDMRSKVIGAISPRQGVAHLF